MRLVAGLGNPGPEYENHRHNIGFRVVERLATRAGVVHFQEKFSARVAQADVDNIRVVFVLPHTFMNGSGAAVAPAARFFKVPAADILVVHDELDLPFGRLQLKAGGGTGGHNGLASIVESLGDDAFARLRFGIGKPEGENAKARVVGHVLSEFSKDERAGLAALIDQAADTAHSWLVHGLAEAMNRHNRK
ncbi:MAG: aminoacyl-tRNA hydrolase [Myxococcaceae bacterium]